MADGYYRKNVGIIILHPLNFKVLFFKRYKEEQWQFPQGGIGNNELVIDCLFRELYEEVGFKKQNVSIIANGDEWLYYKFPPEYRKNNFIGQKQMWFLLSLKNTQITPNFNLSCKKQEFDNWKWIDYKEAVDNVIYFKKNTYKQILDKFAPFLLKKQL